MEGSMSTSTSTSSSVPSSQQQEAGHIYRYASALMENSYDRSLDIQEKYYDEEIIKRAENAVAVDGNGFEGRVVEEGGSLPSLPDEQEGDRK